MDKIRTNASGLYDLPSLSPLSVQLLNIVSDDDVTINKLADIIRQDATLTARIISLANAAYFGQSSPIFSVEDAIFKALGLRLTKNMALSIALMETFDSQATCPAFDSYYFWLKAVTTASLAQSLCGLMYHENCSASDMAYLAGLLHDFGLIPLVVLYPNEINELLSLVERGTSIHDRVREKLDTDHHEVGAWLAKKWKIPDPIILVIAHHTDPGYQGEYEQLVALIHVCSSWAEHYIATGKWDGLPEDVVPVIKRLDLDEEKVIIALKRMHLKFSAIESMAGAIAEEQN
ncbi:MAG: HDOD domain-containing protein [Gammaproteobacteria bacterium]|nr:HDOD domain-containing protein [Gammaproteobacteria bacterium]